MTRILCVEDNEDNIYLVKMRLEMIEGFDITVAKDGAEGVSLAAADPFDLILMDLNLPVMNGWEAARRLKADARTAGIPVIADRARDGRRSRERTRGGLDEFDTKPIDFDRPVQKIRNLVGP